MYNKIQKNDIGESYVLAVIVGWVMPFNPSITLFHNYRWVKKRNPSYEFNQYRIPPNRFGISIAYSILESLKIIEDFGGRFARIDSFSRAAGRIFFWQNRRKNPGGVKSAPSFTDIKRRML